MSGPTIGSERVRAAATLPPAEVAALRVAAKAAATTLVSDLTEKLVAIAASGSNPYAGTYAGGDTYYAHAAQVKVPVFEAPDGIGGQRWRDELREAVRFELAENGFVFVDQFVDGIVVRDEAMAKELKANAPSLQRAFGFGDKRRDQDTGGD